MAKTFEESKRLRGGDDDNAEDILWNDGAECGWHWRDAEVAEKDEQHKRDRLVIAAYKSQLATRHAEIRALVEAGRHFENLAFLFSLFGNGRTQEEHDAFVGMEDFKKHKATLAQYAEGGKDE